MPFSCRLDEPNFAVKLRRQPKEQAASRQIRSSFKEYQIPAQLQGKNGTLAR